MTIREWKEWVVRGRPMAAEAALKVLDDWCEMREYLVVTADIGSVITGPAAQRVLDALKCKE